MTLPCAFRVVVGPAVVGAILLAVSYAPMHGRSGAKAPVRRTAGLYDPDANQIWNKVHNSLLVRRTGDGAEYGSDVVDPLLWANTKFLREPHSRSIALESLDEFLKADAATAIADPGRRAVFQHDLWAVFDWAASADSAPAKNRTLLQRLAEVMRSVALTSDQIAALPDTYLEAVASREFAAKYDPANPQRAFLPPDLLQPDGSWTCLTGYTAEPTALVHFSGRSRFLVFLRLPGRRQATLEYLRKLGDSPEPLFVAGDDARFKLLNLRLPQFPAGTEVALLRQMMVLNADGKLEATSLTESVQLRVYHSVTSGSAYINYENGPSSHDQDFYEIHFSRPALFAHARGGLRAVVPGEKDFSPLFSFGIDPFEASRKYDRRLREPDDILARCRACHVDSGIHSVQSREHWLGDPPRNRELGSQSLLSRAVRWETEATIRRKREQKDFKLLLRYWRLPKRPTSGLEQ